MICIRISIIAEFLDATIILTNPKFGSEISITAFRRFLLKVKSTANNNVKEGILFVPYYSEVIR